MLDGMIPLRNSQLSASTQYNRSYKISVSLMETGKQLSQDTDSASDFEDIIKVVRRKMLDGMVPLRNSQISASTLYNRS